MGLEKKLERLLSLLVFYCNVKVVVSSTFSPNLSFSNSEMMPHEYEQPPQSCLIIRSSGVDGVEVVVVGISYVFSMEIEP